LKALFPAAAVADNCCGANGGVTCDSSDSPMTFFAAHMTHSFTHLSSSVEKNNNRVVCLYKLQTVAGFAFPHPKKWLSCFLIQHTEDDHLLLPISRVSSQQRKRDERRAQNGAPKQWGAAVAEADDAKQQTFYHQNNSVCFAMVSCLHTN
jgi:hypothetical protein